VTFSDLSRNPRAVAERASRLGRLRVAHRDAADFYLTAADREEQRDENLVTASRMFAALSDATELVIDGNAHELIAGWRAIARIKADKHLHARALAQAEGDFGPVETLA
jgi:hypothetical protein